MIALGLESSLEQLHRSKISISAVQSRPRARLLPSSPDPVPCLLPSRRPFRLCLASALEARAPNMAQEYLSKALPILAVGAAAVASAFGILKAVEAGKSRGASAIVEEFERKKEVILADIKKDSELLQQKVTKIYDSLEKDIQAFLANWNEEEVKANPDKAKKILDELAKIEFPGADKIKLAADWAGTNLLLPVITFLGEEAKKLLPPSAKAKEST